MYVMSPSPQFLPSYSDCAADIVRDAPNPSRLDASCCIVEVVNGGLARRETSRSVTSWTNRPAPFAAASISAAAASASALDPGSIFPSLVPEMCVNAPSNDGVALAPDAALRPARTSQYSSRTNRSMSNSRSHTRRSAALCTRPALSRSREGIFRHSTPESVNPKR